LCRGRASEKIGRRSHGATGVRYRGDEVLGTGKEAKSPIQFGYYPSLLHLSGGGGGGRRRVHFEVKGRQGTRWLGSERLKEDEGGDRTARCSESEKSLKEKKKRKGENERKFKGEGETGRGGGLTQKRRGQE